MQALAAERDGPAALALMEQMRGEGVAPSADCYEHCLFAAAHAGGSVL
jgi:hypothetical protein